VVTWLFGGYAVFAAVLIGCATYAALFGRDKQRRADAYRVLKLILGSVAGIGGLVAAIVKLHDAGFL
jgi:hypothetical protein